MKKRAVAIIISSLIVLLSVIYPGYTARAAALPSLAYTAIPMIYEVMTSMFVAQGIGDSEYWNSKSSSEKKNLEDQFQAYYAGYDLTDEEKKYLSYYQKNEHSGQWLIAPISSGQLMVSRTIMDIAANFANEMDFLNNGADSSVTYDPTDYQEILTKNLVGTNIQYEHVNLGDVLGMISSVDYNESWNKVNEYILNLDDSQGITVSFASGTNIDVYTYDASQIVNGTIKTVTNNTGSTGRNRVILTYSNITYHYTGFWRGQVHTDETRTSDFAIGINTISPPWRLGLGLGGNNIKEFGTLLAKDFTVVTGSSIPVGEKGQTTIDNGTVTLPYEQGQHVNIDNYGDSVPLSLPDNIAKDLVIWQGAIENAADAVVQGVEAIQQQALPIDYTQSVAQAGTVAISEPIAIAPDILGNIPAFTVPDFIKRKFPFCIPFDLVDAMTKFNNAGSVAPVIDYNLVISGQNVNIHFDFAVFDEVARVVRVGVLILSVIGLIKATGDLIKW